MEISVSMEVANVWATQTTNNPICQNRDIVTEWCLNRTDTICFLSLSSALWPLYQQLSRQPHSTINTPITPNFIALLNTLSFDMDHHWHGFTLVRKKTVNPTSTRAASQIDASKQSSSQHAIHGTLNPLIKWRSVSLGNPFQSYTMRFSLRSKGEIILLSFSAYSASATPRTHYNPFGWMLLVGRNSQTL